MLDIKKIVLAILFLVMPIESSCKFNYLNTKFSDNTQCKFAKSVVAPRDVERWHASRKVFSKPLSCHLLDTCWFTYLLASAHNEMTQGKLDPYKCAMLASFHDYLEVYTGDILSTFKRSNKKAKKICLEEERKAFSDFIESVPEKFKIPLKNTCEIFIKEPNELSEEENTILKLIKYADLMSAYCECLEELSVGNVEFEEPSKYLKDRLKNLAKESPAMEYFYSQMIQESTIPDIKNLT